MSNVTDVKGTEKAFADFGLIKITSAHFMVPQQTYVLAGITSVKFGEISSDTKPFTYFSLGVLVFLGLGVVGAKWEYIAFSIILALAGWGISLKPRLGYFVILRTSSGEERAYRSYKQTEIEDIIKSLNEAVMCQP